MLTLQPSLTKVWLLSMSTMAVVLHKHVRGGGVRLCMMAALVQDGRAVCPGYAAV